VPFQKLRFEQLTPARIGQELTAAAPWVAMRALRDPPSGFQCHGCSGELSGQRDVASSPYLPVDRHSSALANQRMAAAASARLEPSGQGWVSTSVPGPQRSPRSSSIGWRSNVRDGHHDGKLEPRSPPGPLRFSETHLDFIRNADSNEVSGACCLLACFTTLLAWSSWPAQSHYI